MELDASAENIILLKISKKKLSWIRQLKKKTMLIVAKKICCENNNLGSHFWALFYQEKSGKLSL
jgi:hypothetical protein